MYLDCTIQFKTAAGGFVVLVNSDWCDMEDVDGGAELVFFLTRSEHTEQRFLSVLSVQSD